MSNNQRSSNDAGLRVLVVEDHVDSATAVARLLKMEGHRPQVARDCKSAMSLAESEGFDLVISDIGLPDCSGHELMRLLKALSPIKGIALSGHVTPVDEARVGMLASAPFGQADRLYPVARNDRPRGGKVGRRQVIPI